MLERYRMFAGYNAWANDRVYEAAATLSDADFAADRGAFFGSLCGTLNHLLVADRMWMKRFTGEAGPLGRLDEIVHDRLAPLRVARQAEDRRIAAYVEGLAPADLTAAFHWTSVSTGQSAVQPLWSALDHFFNHQTHHRGQAHGLLTAAGAEGPALDMPIFQRACGLSRGL